MPTAYKLFRISKKNKGCLFPLYVNADKPTPIGEWITAESGERVGNKVKSRLGLLAFRPGWHLSDLPIAVHIGKKDDNGKIAYMKPNVVWCKCSYTDSINYQEAADNSPKSFLDYIPSNGYYRYKTNPQMIGDWILAGGIMIEEVLSDKTVTDILKRNGIISMPRYGGELNLQEYGF